MTSTVLNVNHVTSSMFITCLFFVLAVKSAYIENAPSSQLVMFTSVEGKTFFGDTTKRDWNATGEYCRSQGLKLASITSTGQVNALKAAYKPEFGNDYWTSGRDAHTWRQFTWNETDVQVGSYLDFIDRLEPLTCLIFHYYGQVNVGYHYFPCSGPNVGAGTLCERLTCDLGSCLIPK